MIPLIIPSILPFSTFIPTTQTFSPTCSTFTLPDLALIQSNIQNPYDCVRKEIDTIDDNINAMIEKHNTNHPILDIAAKYYFDQSGKHVRPAFILLLSKSLYKQSQSQFKNNASDPSSLVLNRPMANGDSPLSATFSEWNRNAYNAFLHASHDFDSSITPSQLRLAEITEMIHTASLIHDDILDDADLRRGHTSLNSVIGNKRAVLAGDFLLGKASIALARLHHVEVIELLSRTIADLVQGEFLQMNNDTNGNYDSIDLEMPVPFSNIVFNPDEMLQEYLQKSYLKTASLIANSCCAAALLGGSSFEQVSDAFAFGKDVGLAFQLIDDALDFSGTTEELGKPVGSDLSNGIITAPVIFALQEAPEIITPLMERKFSVPGDVERCISIVREKTSGLDKTLELAQRHSKSALTLVSKWTQSEYRDSLMLLVDTMMKRTK